MIFQHIPGSPVVIKDCSKHSMGQSLRRYVQRRVHKAVDEWEYTRIRVVGLYDRSCGVSSEEKKGKLENWQRPTAALVDGELEIRCYPGRAYVFHYGSLIATHLALKGHNEPIVGIDLPTDIECRAAMARAGIEDLPTTPILVIAAGNDQLAPNATGWADHGSFLTRTEAWGATPVTWMAVKHSFWGDIAYHLGRCVAKAGFERVVFVGKLGSLVPDHEPNRTLATGCSSRIENQVVRWCSELEQADVVTGRHITLPSVLQETTRWVEEHRSRFDFVDPEIGNMAAGVRDGGGAFSYLHIISDNVVKYYPHNLSNEREKDVLDKRAESYRRIASILRDRYGSNGVDSDRTQPGAVP